MTPSNDTIREIVRMQNLLIKKQKEFTVALRNGAKATELAKISEELTRLYQIVADLRAKA
ncbi:hypothetical protein GCM10023184_28950 [Flaviaesturariibacter amylovorans]|uniref:Lacal_2735 family protein n=1 Tax=Flaviaesturariibacter amylovorans TaxID=1084520 RepID=A0ABP8H5M4_9BACT